MRIYLIRNMYVHRKKRLHKKIDTGFCTTNLLVWSLSLCRPSHGGLKEIYKKRVFIHRDHSSITSSKRWVGGVSKWQFLMIYSTVNHQRGGSVGLKKSKTWWRNTWMAPYYESFPIFLPSCSPFPHGGKLEFFFLPYVLDLIHLLKQKFCPDTNFRVKAMYESAK